MKKTTINVSFDDERLAALKLYLEQKGQSVENELEKALESLYAKSVPSGVREFLDMRTGSAPTSKPRKSKPSPSAVGSPECEVKD